MKTIIICTLGLMLSISCNKSTIEKYSGNTSGLARAKQEAQSFNCGYDVTAPDSTSILEPLPQVFYYYLNNQSTSDTTLLSDSTLSFLLEGWPNVDSSVQNVNIRAYSTLEGLLTYTDSAQIPLREGLAAGDHLYNYAVSTGTIDTFNQYGYVPQFYIDYECAYMDSVWSSITGLPINYRMPDISWLYTEYYGYGHSAPVIHALPVMWPGWNNKVSSFYSLSIPWGVDILFDKRFFRKFMGAITGWGWGPAGVSFNGPLLPLDNKASSWLKPM